MILEMAQSLYILFHPATLETTCLWHWLLVHRATSPCLQFSCLSATSCARISRTSCARQSPPPFRKELVGNGSYAKPRTYLMVGKDQRVGKHHVLSPSSSKHHDFCNIIWRERLAPGVYGVGFCFVAVESYNGEFLAR